MPSSPIVDLFHWLKSGTETPVSEADPLPVDQPALNGKLTNQIPVGTSPVQVATAASTKNLIVKANVGNDGLVYVGDDNSVTTLTGYELAARDFLEIPSGAECWLVADTPGQRVSTVRLDAT